MNYAQIIGWLDLAVFLAFFVFICVLWYYVLYFFIAIFKIKKFDDSKEFTKFAVLIPARNESKVIRNILNSLKNMDYPKEFFDVFVIVEDGKDPTIEICKEFGAYSVVRGSLENRRTKGFALDDAYNYIKKNNLKYDAYMVFDADNVIDNQYLKHMNNVRQNGFQVGTGYRSFTNATKNWVTATSATLFSFMNQFTSKGRSYLFQKATLTGTGYFINSEIVDDAGGWIWNGMTEDVELTTYCYYHNIKMKYYPYAKYYDEQPESYKVLHNQHVRWVWGFFASKKKFKTGGKVYEPKSKINRFLSIVEYNTSIFPFVVLNVTLLCAAIGTLGVSIAAIFTEPQNAGLIFGHSVLQFSLLYITFMFTSAFTLGIDNKNLQFSVSQSIHIVFTYFFFFGDFLFAFIDGLFHKKKRTLWKEIEHKGNIVDSKAVEIENAKKG